MRVNVGCGQTPTKGWRNFDNSPSLRLARIPLVTALLERLNLLAKEQLEYIRFARHNHLQFADASVRLPIEDASVDALYSSHMLEHLTPGGAARFLQEAKRVLKRGGILRLVVPDLRLLVNRYLETNDADDFIRCTHVCDPNPSSVFRRIITASIGARHHLWMYDGPSLCRLLSRHGFASAHVVPAGSTRIPDPGELDLYERADESVYVEAERA